MSEPIWGQGNPLLDAHRDGDINSAKCLIRAHPKLASRRINRQGQTAMHYICDVADATTVKALVGEVPPEFLCSLRDNETRNLVHMAAEKGKEEVVRVLVNACPKLIQGLTSLAETPLLVALKNGQIGCFFALMELLQQPQYIDWMELLNRRDWDGNTLLLIAVSRKQAQMVGALLSYKQRNGDRVVDVNSTNNLGSTALDLHIQHMPDANDREISDILHEAKAKRGHELRRCHEGQSVQKMIEKFFLENSDIMKKSLLLVVFIFIATDASSSLSGLSSIYPIEHPAEILTINVKDMIRCPSLLPAVFYAIMADTVTFLSSMVMILVITWSLSTKCSLCYRAVPLLLTVAVLVRCVLVTKTIMPKFWMTIGPHKIPSFLAVWLFDLPLLFLSLAIWLMGKYVLILPKLP
ncbi:ankyrin repeat-containing protein At2g01680-like [Cornus florida]|uniref:ankyrin repeat-containing protein At2g01680-like n=1 Tax=Cornus florida TaxID=4283 RepID=UPI0028A044AD|nr:ankyrin repeat-containing protein At2g01680-like [Cornus florida]